MTIRVTHFESGYTIEVIIFYLCIMVVHYIKSVQFIYLFEEVIVLENCLNCGH